jgi:uncharacterized protein (UPF0147 family)
LADQTDKLSGFKSELDRIKTQLKRGNLRTGEAQALLRRGRELERIVDDASLVRGVKAATQKPLNPFNTDTSPEDIEAEQEEIDEEASDELDTEEEINNADDQQSAVANEAKKEELAENIESGIEKNEGFAANTAAGQKAAAETEKAKAAGGPIDPTKAQSGTPAAPPTPSSTEPALPGGAAISAGTTLPAEGGAANGTKTATPKPAEENAQGTSGTGSLSDRARQLGAQIQTGIKDGAKNVREQINKRFSKEAMKLLLKSPLFWWIVGGIIALALIAGVAFAIFGSLWSTGNSGTNGNTYTQALDPIKDKDWLSKLLEYSGDTEIKDEKSKEEIAIVKKALTDIQADMTVSEKVRGQATTALNDLAQYENSPGLAKAGKAAIVLADIKGITDIYFACKSLYTNTYFSIGPAGELQSLKDKGVLPATLVIGGKTYANPEFPLDPRLCGLLTAMSDSTSGIDHTKIPLLRLTFRGNHSSPGKPGDHTTSHYCGQGVDINDPTVQGDEVVLSAEIKRWMWLNKDTLQKNNFWPEEMFGGPPYTQQINDHVEAPTKQFDDPNHVHIGFGYCIKK